MYDGFVKPGSVPVIDNRETVLGGALKDLASGLGNGELWFRLGWIDILQRYRRSLLGPFWLTITMGVLVGSLGFLYAALFKLPLADYLPFLCLGFIIWQLISGLIVEGCSAFIAAEGVIKQIRMPFSLHVYRLAWRNCLIFFHNIVVFLLIAAIFQIPVTIYWCWALIGVVFIAINGIWLSLLLGLLCARFRDVQAIIASIVQISFFVTPIIWKPSIVPDKIFILEFNPFYYFVEIVRGPLLGSSVPSISWIVVLGITVCGWLVTIPIFGTWKHRLVYWL